ncbi:MAG: hypothetical protein N4A31_01915 [Rickettsiales bacterium]|jgi:hypothetical protein|nr:hypothetical protein [Rickettsiales bacterium]
MPRDIAVLTAQFESSNNAEKINLFREIVNETIIQFQSGQLAGANITEILNIFQSMNQESSAMIEIAEVARDVLLELQHNNNELYTNQIEPINTLLDFLRPYQYSVDDQELTFGIDDDSDSGDEIKDDSIEENQTETITTVHDPTRILEEIKAITQGMYPRKMSGSPNTFYFNGIDGNMPCSYRDWVEYNKNPFGGDTYDPDGGIM